jgi:signal transduction histidine kinase
LQPTDLVALVHGVLAGARMRSPHHLLAFTAPAQSTAYIDPLRFEQVVDNLVDNAIKYSPEGRQITISLAHLEDAVELEVRDHGTGIPPDQRDRIFDRFYQAHTANHASGMGLGLFISREIIEQHGGSLTAEFPPDGGTRMVVRLPASRVVPRSA